MIRADNSSVAFYINLKGRHARLLRLTFQLYDLTDRFESKDNKARHIPSVSNVLTDALSMSSKPSPTEWMLHPEAFKLVTKAEVYLSVCNQVQQTDSNLCFLSTRLICLGQRRTGNIMTSCTCMPSLNQHCYPWYYRRSCIQEPATALHCALLAGENMLSRLLLLHYRKTNSKAPELVKSSPTFSFKASSSNTESLQASCMEHITNSLTRWGYLTSAPKVLSSALCRTIRNLYDNKWKSFDQFTRSKGYPASKATSPQVSYFLCHLQSNRNLQGFSFRHLLASYELRQT